MWKSFNKYKAIVFAITLFILFDIGVLVLNFYISFQISDDTRTVNLAARQRMLVQKLSSKLYEVQEALRYGKATDLEMAVSGLSGAYKQFDETMDSFIYGGRLMGKGQKGEYILINKKYLVALSEVRNEINLIWSEYRRLLSPIVYYEYDDFYNIEKMNQNIVSALAFSKRNNDQLSKLMGRFTNNVEFIAHSNTARLRYVQALGIILALLGFFIILFHFIRNLIKRDKVADEAKKENEVILQTVGEGLFLINKDFTVEPQYSTSMEKYFNKSNIAGMSLFDLLEDMITCKTSSTARDYIELLFGARVKEKLIKDLNPLNNIEVQVEDEQGRYVSKFLSLEFKRVWRDGDLRHLLVTVNDITKIVSLNKALEIAQGESSVFMHQFLSLLHIEHKVLNQFVLETESSLKMINDILEAPAGCRLSYQDKLSEIFRVTHRIKEDASLLGLKDYESKMHALEDELENPKIVDKLIENNFLPIAMQLHELLKHVELTKKLSRKIVEIQERLIFENKRDDRVDYPIAVRKRSCEIMFKVLVDELTINNNLAVSFRYEGCELGGVSDIEFQLIISSISHLIRNAMVHGLEPAQERVRMAKSECARLELLMSRMGDVIRVTVKDDGRGIDITKIREKALKTGKWSEQELKNWTDKDIAALIFIPGLSTQNTGSKDTGRGQGMTIVKENIEKMNGGIKFKSKLGAYTEFEFEVKVAGNHGGEVSPKSYLEKTLDLSYAGV